MRVVLAVDGSDQSFEAVRAVGCLAKAEQLIILHAVDLPQLTYPALGPQVATDLSMTVEQAMKEEGERYLDRAASLLPPHHGPVVKRLEIGDPAAMILNVAEETGAHLIVLGARGLGQVRELVMGSVSHRVSSHATCPTFIVKAPLRQVRHALLPVESQEDADVAVGFLATKPFHDMPRVTVIHVIPYSDPVWPVGALIPESFRKEMLGHAEELTNHVAGRLSELGYEATGTAVMGAPSVRLVDELSENSYDLLLMRSKNRTPVSRFFMGSVSHAVMHHTTCSILLLR